MRSICPSFYPADPASDEYLHTDDKWKKCSLHLWKKHGLDLDLLSCALCPGIKMANFSQLEVHNKTHSDERQFVCSVCQKGFKQMAQLRNHSVIHLDKTRSVVPSWFAKKQCDLCEKFFADSKCLKKHVQAVHSKLKPYSCRICNHQESYFNFHSLKRLKILSIISI